MPFGISMAWPPADRGVDGRPVATLWTGAASRAPRRLAPRYGLEDRPCPSHRASVPMPPRRSLQGYSTTHAADRTLACGQPLLVGALRAIDRSGLVVGRDLALVGWDDILLAELYHPPIAVVDRDLHAIGAAAATWQCAASDMPPRSDPNRPHRDPAGAFHPARLLHAGARATRRVPLPVRRDERMADLFAVTPARRALVTGGASGSASARRDVFATSAPRSPSPIFRRPSPGARGGGRFVPSPSMSSE